MPYVRIVSTAGRTEEQKAKLASVITDAMQHFFGATPATTFVIFEDVPRENWAVGGQLVSRREK